MSHCCATHSFPSCPLSALLLSPSLSLLLLHLALLILLLLLLLLHLLLLLLIFCSSLTCISKRCQRKSRAQKHVLGNFASAYLSYWLVLSSSPTQRWARIETHLQRQAVIGIPFHCRAKHPKLVTSSFLRGNFCGLSSRQLVGSDCHSCGHLMAIRPLDGHKAPPSSTYNHW